MKQIKNKKLAEYCRLTCNIHPKWQILEKEEEVKNVKPSY